MFIATLVTGYEYHDDYITTGDHQVTVDGPEIITISDVEEQLNSLALVLVDEERGWWRIDSISRVKTLAQEIGFEQEGLMA